MKLAFHLMAVAILLSPIAHAQPQDKAAALKAEIRKTESRLRELRAQLAKLGAAAPAGNQLQYRDLRPGQTGSLAGEVSARQFKITEILNAREMLVEELVSVRVAPGRFSYSYTPPFLLVGYPTADLVDGKVTTFRHNTWKVAPPRKIGSRTMHVLELQE